MDVSSLNFRRHIRQALTALGDQRYGSTLGCAVRALASSPQLFVSRILYQFYPPQHIYVGRPPALFGAHFRELWPGAGDSPRDSACLPAQWRRQIKCRPAL